MPQKKERIHLGIIPDGNRRFAEKRGLRTWEGHKKGAEKIKHLLEWCLEYPEIKTISIFALSTENLGRPEKEVNGLWDVYREEFRNMVEDPRIKDNRIRVNIMGDRKLWKPDVAELAKSVVDATKSYSRYILNILLAYGSKFEITKAVERAGRALESIEKYLMVREPLNLVIRTGGQRRLSNFMLYQASYAEIYFSDTLWPEFTKKEFQKIMGWFHEQRVRFGR